MALLTAAGKAAVTKSGMLAAAGLVTVQLKVEALLSQLHDAPQVGA